MAEPKEILEKVYEAVELARKTGKIRKGTNEVIKAIERGEAKLVVAAEDVNPPEIIMPLKPLCKEKGVLYLGVPSKEELGAAAGLQLATASIAITKEGDAKDIIKTLTNPKGE